MPGPGETLLSAVERLPSVRTVVGPHRRSAAVYVGARLVAEIDLDQDGAVVHTPADTIPTLLGVFPSSRRTANGIAFDLSEASHAPQALAAIERRAHVETLVPQFREASP
jgi:hypothetical protein